MIEELEYPFDGNLILRKKRDYRHLLLESKPLGTIPLKIALLGGSTITPLRESLELFLLNRGICPEFYESQYNRFYEDGVFSNPELDAFCPDVAVICTSTHNISCWPLVTDNREDVERKLRDEYCHFEAVWNALSQRFSCVIIQTNMESPAWRMLGSMDACDFRGHSNFTVCLNQLFYEYAQNHCNFYIQDIHTLSAEFGLNRWHDMRQWNLYKCAQSMEAIPLYAYQLASIILALRGKAKKAIVLDADNTLWGGVIGECGSANIALGHETAKGQAFLEWQQYLKALKDRGILLLIASKNEQENVLAGLSHPDSVLHADDFAAMAVNWNDKASNIRSLSTQINISCDQMLFVDDSPVERALIKKSLSGITVLDADTPDGFIRVLQEGRYLETLSLSDEDSRRTQMYHENALRDKEKNLFLDYNAFLQSLEMKAKITPFEKSCYERIVQLANKTNQFNLTGRRVSLSEIVELAANKDWICLSGKLSDRFGDNGIVCLIFALCHEDTATIHNFLMSCRVFGRGMEYAMMDSFIRNCRGRGISKIKAEYVPTAKNIPVKNFYQNMGFSLENTDGDGRTFWSLSLDAYVPHDFYMEVN